MHPTSSLSTKFFAVARGRQIGVYHNWRSANRQVNKFPTQLVKGFSNPLHAEAWIHKMQARFLREHIRNVRLGKAKPSDFTLQTQLAGTWRMVAEGNGALKPLTPEIERFILNEEGGEELFGEKKGGGSKAMKLELEEGGRGGNGEVEEGVEIPMWKKVEQAAKPLFEEIKKNHAKALLEAEAIMAAMRKEKQSRLAAGLPAYGEKEVREDGSSIDKWGRVIQPTLKQKRATADVLKEAEREAAERGEYGGSGQRGGRESTAYGRGGRREYVDNRARKSESAWGDWGDEKVDGSPVRPTEKAWLAKDQKAGWFDKPVDKMPWVWNGRTIGGDPGAPPRNDLVEGEISGLKEDGPKIRFVGQMKGIDQLTPERQKVFRDAALSGDDYKRKSDIVGVVKPYESLHPALNEPSEPKSDAWGVFEPSSLTDSASSGSPKHSEPPKHSSSSAGVFKPFSTASQTSAWEADEASHRARPGTYERHIQDQRTAWAVPVGQKSSHSKRRIDDDRSRSSKGGSQPWMGRGSKNSTSRR